MDSVIRRVKNKFHHSHSHDQNLSRRKEEPLSDSVKNLLEVSVENSQNSEAFTVGDEFKLTEEMKQLFHECQKNHNESLVGWFPDNALEAQILEDTPYQILKVFSTNLITQIKLHSRSGTLKSVSIPLSQVNKSLTKSEQTQTIPKSPKETSKKDKSKKIEAMRRELQDSWGDIEFSTEKLSKFKKSTFSKLK